MPQPRYSVVIPTMNEAGNIVELARRIENVLKKDFEIIVVDENSPDGTYNLIKEYGKGKNYIRPMLNDGERGLSPSIVKGFDNAQGEFLCCMDGDLQHDETCLVNMFKAAENADMVIGSRYVSGGGFADKWNPVRKIISSLSAMIANIMLGTKLTDPTSGFFVVRKSSYNEIRNSLNPKGFKIMLETFFNLKNAGKSYRIVEEGIIFRNRTSGSSKLSFKVILLSFKMLYQLRRRKK